MMKRLLPPAVVGLAMLTLNTSCKPKTAAIPAQPAADATTDRTDVASANETARPQRQNGGNASQNPQADAGNNGGGNRQSDGNLQGNGGNRQNAGNNRQGGGNRQFGGNGGGGNPEQRRAERMQQMKTDLGLTDDQAQKISAIFQAQFGAAGGQMSREDRRAAFEKARAEVDKILTPEQKTKWEAMRQQWQQRRGGGGNGGQGNGGGYRVN